MKKRMKELLAIFLSASMMLSVAPTTAFAENGGGCSLSRQKKLLS